jgi:hypothetical protein
MHKPESLGEFHYSKQNVVAASLENKTKKLYEKVQFIPSNHKISLEHFGYIKDNSCWLKNSLILNEEECLFLAEMTNSTKGNLLYRAIRDGFEAQAFHTRCDGKSNTITIINNNFNDVFGGYASSAWNSSGRYIHDENAFLFSLRRNRINSKDQFITKRSSNLIHDQPEIFHSDHGIFISNKSNIYNESFTDFDGSYNLPDCAHSESYFAGHDSQLTPTEINDPESFILSLRRHDISSNDKFMTKNPGHSLYGNSNYGPTFGSGHDILICNQSNINNGSFTRFGNSYDLPDGFTYGGNYNQWITTEIEVYQIV